MEEDVRKNNKERRGKREGERDKGRKNAKKRVE